MKFDPVSLRPLYSLEMGEAGESCALLIAQRLGMPMDVINRARRAVEGEISCEVRPREGSRARFERYDAPKAVSERAARFGRGDSVRIYPAGEIGIVVEQADDMGCILVHTRTGKRLIPHKRLKLLVKADALYPEDYEFSIIFDTVANRKAATKWASATTRIWWSPRMRPSKTESRAPLLRINPRLFQVGGFVSFINYLQFYFL